jgi:hypothetical protein
VPDILILRAFIAAGHEKNPLLPALGVVDSIARPEVKPQFPDAFPNVLVVTGSTFAKLQDARKYSLLCSFIPKLAEPLVELRGFAEHDHEAKVANWIQAWLQGGKGEAWV